MKKKWTWSQMLLAAVAVALLVSGSTLFAAKGGGGKPPKGDPPPPEPVELPDVRYEIQLIELPANWAGGGGTYIHNMNNLGQVVGHYRAEDGNRAFVINGDQVFDLNEIVTAGVPDGWHLQSGWAINDWMVVVGRIEKTGSDPIETRPIAIDLATVDPVVDLLPDVGGFFALSLGYQINETVTSWAYTIGGTEAGKPGSTILVCTALRRTVPLVMQRRWT